MKTFVVDDFNSNETALISLIEWVVSLFIAALLLTQTVHQTYYSDQELTLLMFAVVGGVKISLHYFTPFSCVVTKIAIQLAHLTAGTQINSTRLNSGR